MHLASTAEFRPREMPAFAYSWFVRLRHRFGRRLHLRPRVRGGLPRSAFERRGRVGAEDLWPPLNVLPEYSAYVSQNSIPRVDRPGLPTPGFAGITGLPAFCPSRVRERRFGF